MIICRTPFRVSFFGGGTDFPSWYRQHQGSVLSTSIDKYCYLSCRFLPPFFEHKSRIVYSKTEHISSHDEIDHPAIRAALKYLNIQEGVEIHYNADMPARTGIGSSSSLVVGLLNGLSALKNITLSKVELARQSIYLEREVLKETGGTQDQIAVAFGGFNKIDFFEDSSFSIKPIAMKHDKLEALQEHMLLCFTSISRYSSDIAEDHLKNIEKNVAELAEMQKLVSEAETVLTSNNDITDFGKLLHETWLLKKSLSKNITSSKVDEIYEEARSTGALGGKILGAGGGGFLLLFAKPELHAAIKKRLAPLLLLKFRFENSGSQIIFTDHTSSSTAWKLSF